MSRSSWWVVVFGAPCLMAAISICLDRVTAAFPPGGNPRFVVTLLFIINMALSVAASAISGVLSQRTVIALPAGGLTGGAVGFIGFWLALTVFAVLLEQLE